MLYLFMGIFAVAVVVLDQLTKFLVVNNIAEGGIVPVLDGVLHLTFVKNTGAAFSSFEGQQWLFVLIFLIFTAAIIWEFSKKRMPFTTFERWCIVGIYTGGLANMIDRVRLQYVVDMIALDFLYVPSIDFASRSIRWVPFAVFNVADCFITCGCIVLLVHLLLFNRKFWKDEKK